jgi:pimeloyl-ACP methyl ester carboxylesterase
MLGEEVAALSGHFTCILPDTPGFALSDKLAGEVLTVADLADAVAENLDAIGMPPCPVFGTHTGAAIALELAARHPGRVTGLVMDGVPIFGRRELDSLFDGYFAPLGADPLGGHLTRTWMRFRDQHTWFPWHSRRRDRMNEGDRPTPEEIHFWVSLFMASHATYAPAYRAAVFYGDRAIEAARAITCPAVFMASGDDMLHPHLERLPPLGEGQTILRLPPRDVPAKMDALLACLRALPRAKAPRTGFNQSITDKGFFYLDGAEIFARFTGLSYAPALFLLHDGLETGAALEPLGKLLPGFRCILPDLPGCGESGPPPPGSDVLSFAAASIAHIADALDLAQFWVLGLGCGASVASVLAGRGDPRLKAVVLDGTPLPDPVLAAGLAPVFDLAPDGSHWVRTWLMLRDAEIYHPWFDGRYAARRPTQGNFDATYLHDRTVEVMKARETHGALVREAYAHDPRADLAAAKARVVFTGRADTMLAGNDAALAAELSLDLMSPAPRDLAELAERLGEPLPVAGQRRQQQQ